METKLKRIAEIAKAKPKERFTSLIHLINEKMIIKCHREASKNKATGIDNITKEEYEANLEQSVKELISRMKRQAYKPQSVKRVYIPKVGTSKERPLGIPAYEDKLVQIAIRKILNAIYEQDFLECSFGFRPNRGCHDALKILNNILNMKEINYVVDVDIKGFFDNVDHEWMKKFIEHRVSDPNFIRLITRFLKAGIMEAGISYETYEGTPQGGPSSPILGNIYLHYVIDIWFEKHIRKICRGKAYMIRYADDNVFCFQHEIEAKKFYATLKERLRKFNLEIAENKSKIISLGKDDNDNDKNGNGGNKSNSFDFLGFTHYGHTDENGRLKVKRKTSKKKYRKSLMKCKTWIKDNKHMPTREFMKKLRIKLNGHIRYYGVTGNRNAVGNFI